MSIRVGINGFGRFGRNYLRCALDRGHTVVGVNDIADPANLAYLLKYDSTYGPLGWDVGTDGSALIVGHRRIPVTSERDPGEVEWGRYGADIVIESTGRFRDRQDAARHLKSGARKVVISAPSGDADATIVIGVNEGTYDASRHDVISGASCTTNCAAPMAKVLNDAFGIVKGYLTTVHGYTNDQVLLDAPHRDMRRGRSAGVNVIPTSTGAARSVGLVIPELAGRLDGIALRVPVEDGSLVDLACVLQTPVTADEVNAAFLDVDEELGRVIRYTTEPMVSRDVVGDAASCVFDALLTQAHGDLVKVYGWYDNEWGYTNRLADLVEHVATV